MQIKRAFNIRLFLLGVRVSFGFTEMSPYQLSQRFSHCTSGERGMTAKVSDHPSRLELFCQLVDRAGLQESISESCFFSEIDAKTKGVVAELALLGRNQHFDDQGGGDASSEQLRISYTSLLIEAATALSSRILAKFLPAPGTWSSELVKIVRTCASLLSACSIHQPRQKSCNDHIAYLMQTAQQIDTYLRQTFDLSASFAVGHCLQRQIARCSAGAIEESCRIAPELFDPRQAAAEVGKVLDKQQKKTMKKVADASAGMTAAPTVVRFDKKLQHVKCLAPLYEITATSGKYSTLQQHLQLLLLLQHAAPVVLPRVGSALQQLLSDVTNLLIRVSAQTPKNSPSVAFLAFLICDVTVTLGHPFCPAASAAFTCLSNEQEHDDVGDDGDDRGIRKREQSHGINILSCAIFSNEMPGASRVGVGGGDLSVICTKLDVALGCALDCLLADIESAVAGACNRFENPCAEDMQYERQDHNRPTSAAMNTLLVTLIHPLLAAMQCCSPLAFSSSSSSSPPPPPSSSTGKEPAAPNLDVVVSKEAQKLVQSVRRQIIASTARLVVSYWMRDEAIARDLERTSAPVPGQKNSEQAERLKARLERPKRDVAAFAQFLQDHPYSSDVARGRQALF